MNVLWCISFFSFLFSRIDYASSLSLNENPDELHINDVSSFLDSFEKTKPPELTGVAVRNDRRLLLCIVFFFIPCTEEYCAPTGTKCCTISNFGQHKWKWVCPGGQGGGENTQPPKKSEP